jgi:hypothetical protein
MFMNRASSCYSINTSSRQWDENNVGYKSLTVSGSRMGGVEAAVLEGVGVVITNEGAGLGETEETVIVVGRENLDALWSRVAQTRLRVIACPKHGHVLLSAA